MKKSVYLLEGYQALGTVWYIELFEQLPSDRLEVLRNDVIQEIISFENKYSRFKSDSLLSLLNKNRTLPYDEDLALMISLAKDAHTKSDGIFDIFIKHKLEQKGYGGTGDILQGFEEKSTARSSEETIILTGTQSIDLGGIGKGFLIDKISRYAQSQGVKEFIVNGGGDMYVTHSNGNAIEVFMKHPTREDEVLGKVMLKNKALCASSSYLRMWNQGGIQKNHFISPDGKEVWAASYVVGDDVVSADIAATVLCITSKDVEKSKIVAEAYGVTYCVFDENFSKHGDLVYEDLTQ